MLLRVLVALVYDETGWKWHQEVTREPAWDHVEASVRRLDQFCYPSVELHLTDDPDDPTQTLTVMGGQGVYWVGLTAGDYDQLRLFDPNRSSREVDLWTSDQGFGDYEFHTTTDVEFVLRIARHFSETAQPLPEASWEPRV